MFDSPGAAFFTCTSFLIAFLDLAMAVVAVVRLKATPAGILLALGFGLSGLVGLAMKIVRAATMDMMIEMEDPTQYFVALTGVQSCASFVYMTLIAVGLFMIPSALRKLGGAAESLPVTR